MGMLYSTYSNPMELMKSYINRGRFGEFVEGFLKAENERRKEESEKDEEWFYRIAYVHSYSEKSYDDWRAELIGSAKETKKKPAGKSDRDLDAAGIDAIFNQLFG